MLGCAIALLVGACGGEETGGGADADPTGGDCPVDALDDARDPSRSTSGTPRSASTQALQKIVDRYKESQDKVRVDLQFQGTFEEQLKKYEDASGDPASLPDIVSPDDTVTQFMADSGTVIPVQSCIDADPDAAAIYDDMVPIVNAAYSIDGVLWPGAFAAAGAAMFINEAHFEAAGLDPRPISPRRSPSCGRWPSRSTRRTSRASRPRWSCGSRPGRWSSSPAGPCSPWSTRTTGGTGLATQSDVRERRDARDLQCLDWMVTTDC